MSRRARFAIVASPGFITAVLVLLVNDHVLKGAFPGVLTGKLSDVSGLFVVGALTVALAPFRPHLGLCVVATAFAWWKSPLSQPLIDAWNSMDAFRVARVIDWTDLLALLALPVALLYARSAFHVASVRVIRAAMLPVTALAIVATSYAPKPMLPDPSADVARFYPQATFMTTLSATDIVQQLTKAGFNADAMLRYGDDVRTNVRCGQDDTPSRTLVAANVRLEPGGEGTAIVLTSAAFCRRFAPPTRDGVIDAFQREVLSSLPDVRFVR